MVSPMATPMANEAADRVPAEPHIAAAISPRGSSGWGPKTDSPLEEAGFEPSPAALDSRFSAALDTLGRIKVDSILDHFWTPANTD
jgi:hypothetical protein